MIFAVVVSSYTVAMVVRKKNMNVVDHSSILGQAELLEGRGGGHSELWGGKFQTLCHTNIVY